MHLIPLYLKGYIDVCEYRSEDLKLEWGCGLQGGVATCYQVGSRASRGSNWADRVSDPRHWTSEHYILVSVPTIGSLSRSAREGNGMRLLVVFVLVQVLHLPAGVDQCGWLCVHLLYIIYNRCYLYIYIIYIGSIYCILCLCVCLLRIHATGGTSGSLDLLRLDLTTLYQYMYEMAYKVLEL